MTAHTTRSVIAGVFGAAAALASGELVTSFGGDHPSLVSAVGNRFIDNFAASLKDVAVRLFGTNDKPALVVGIVSVALLLGAVLGWGSTRRAWIPLVGFGAFGALGAWAYGADARGGVGLGLLASGVAVLVGLVGFRFVRGRSAPVVRVAQPAGVEVTPMPANRTLADEARPDRRTFLLRSALVGAGAVGFVAVSRTQRNGEAVAAIRRTTVIPKATSTRQVPVGLEADVVGISPYITPNGEFYRIDTALVVPSVDTSNWTLTIDGMVDTPFSITYDELLDLALVSEPVTIQCVSNEVGGDLIGTAVWQGVPLVDLLNRAGVKPEAGQIVGRSVDGWTAGFPVEAAFDGRTALVAVAMNGEPLPQRHGFPARLIVAGLYGYVSATKWLERIELTGWDDFDGYWVPRGWSKLGPIKTMSRIDVPRSNAKVQPGKQAVAGVAWAPSLGITKVEVQIGDGEWQECRLGQVASENTWVQWVYEWDAAPGSYAIRVRATDTEGYTQTADTAPPAPDGATGWDTRLVTVEG